MGVGLRSRPQTPNPLHNQLAFVGLGAMGKRMASNLAKHLVATGQVSERVSSHSAGVRMLSRDEDIDDPQPPLMVYNRSDKGMSEFKTYAAIHKVPQTAWRVMKDLQEIGRM